MSQLEKNITEYLVVFVVEFAKHFKLTQTQAFNYLDQFGGMLLLEQQYDYFHTQSFESNIDDIADYCRKKGGTL